MDFDRTEEQRQLVETVGSFVKKQSPVSRLRAMRLDPVGWSRDMWRQMGELGWLAIPFPESVGGLGGSFVDAALILEQLGTTLVPEPFIPALASAAAILKAGTEEQARDWLGPVLAGEWSLALAIDEAQSRFHATDVRTRAERAGGAYRITGEKRWVVNGHAADAIVVSARTSGGERDPDGVSLFVVDRDAPGLHVQPVRSMDGHHAAILRFEGVEIGEDRRLGAEGEARGALELAMDVGAAAACAEGLGVVSTALGMTVDYLKTREQFGVKIGTFQALQHRAVDMFVEVELCRSMAILAALKVGDPDEGERKGAVSAAKVQLAWGGRYVTQQAIQLHGGIGVTDEHDIGLYFKRMNVLNALFGDEEHHVARYAGLPGFTAGIAA
jgi:alkylation response protein AidB-like acyl-CoA dehydrogenase